MLSHLRHALRALRSRPLFSIATILTLALGVGANTAVFSVVHGVLLRDLPFASPSELVTLQLQTRVPIFSKAEYLYLQASNTSFADMVAIGGGRGAVLLEQGPARAVMMSRLTANVLPVLGIVPVLGRGFEPAEQVSGSPAVLIGEDLWTTVFGSDLEVVGRTLVLEGHDGRSNHTIVGVLPRSMQLLHSEAVDLWLPMDLTADLPSKSAGVQIVARRHGSATLGRAQLEFDGLLRSLLNVTTVYPAGYQLSGRVIPLDEWVIGNRRDVLWLLFGAAGFVLVIACANVANLFLVRFARRRPEFAIRAALGADLRAMFSLALAEGLTVALVGGVLGVLIAWWTRDVLVRLLPADLPRLDEIGVDLTVLGLTLAVSTLAACLFASIPVWTLRNVDPSRAMSSASHRTTTSPGASVVQRSIIVLEIALALVLAVGTGLMIKTVMWLRHQDAGLDAANVVAITLQHPVNDAMPVFFGELIDRTRSLPGVASVALTYHLPLSGSNSITTVRLPDHPTIGPDDSQTVGFQIVSDQYFGTMRIPLIRGTLFSQNAAEAESEIIVSEAFARAYWPNTDPIGKVVIGSGSRVIVGVVGDTRHRGLQLDPRPEAYFPLSSFARGDMSLVVRTALPPDVVITSVRRQVAELDPTVPITAVRSMDDIISASYATERHTLELLGAFSALAMVLGAVGVYGVVSYAVSQQRRELGIRLALGARTERLIRMVLGWGLIDTATGVGIGVVLSRGLTRMLESQLFGVPHTDPATLSYAVLVLTVVGIAAAVVPAIRAARIEPIEVMRD